jgi:Carbohydrate binding domain
MMRSLLPTRLAASPARLLRTLGPRGAALLGVTVCLSRCSLSDFDGLSAGLAADRLNNGGLPGGAAGASSSEPDASANQNTGGAGAGGGGAGGNGGSGQTNAGSAGSPPQTGGAGNEPDAGVSSPQNLIEDPGFEGNAPRWIAVGNVALSLTTDNPRGGSSCLRTTNRAQATWEGPGYDLLGLVENVTTYDAAVWVRLASSSQLASLTFKHRCVGETDETATYTNITSVRSTAALEWQLLSGSFTTRSCELISATLFVEGPDVDEDVYIDDASLYPASP